MNKKNLTDLQDYAFRSTSKRTTQDLIERYKILLNRDIEDFSIGIKNIGVKEEMEDIEKKLGELK